MRSSGCAVQQELGGVAAAVMRQAVSLALRRGHAQVTPLHLASAVLSDAAGGFLRAACCLLSSHPLQCNKALELCLDAALNRLATSAVFLLHAQQHAGFRAPPPLSNALAAVLKRARTIVQRRGVAGKIKIELEQLVISILDDPSVSCVLREAGLSSAEVKANVDKAIEFSNANALRVLDCMASGTNRCVVVLSESAAAAEWVVKTVMDKVSKGELRGQHERLNKAHLVPFSAASFQHMMREEVEAWAGDLRECCAAAGAGGVVLVLQDLCSWRRNDDHQSLYYCPVQHAVMELSSIVRGRDKDVFWLLGFGDYVSYTSCRSGLPSLETVLELHTIVVPPDDGRLALSQNLAGDSEITHCSTGRVVALHRCQGGLPVGLTGSELTVSFSSQGASSSRCGSTSKSFEPWHDLVDRRRLTLLNCRHDGPMAKSSYDDQMSLANPNSGYSNLVPRSNPSSEGGMMMVRRRPKFTELTAENFRILCSALVTRVPRHRDIAPGVASVVLQRRSGVMRTTRPNSSATWFLFQGRDNDGKMAMARELARLVFGSYAEFTCIAAAASELTPHHRTLKSTRSPDKEHGGCMQMFYEAIRENPHRVVLVDGVEHDSELEAGIMNAMACGTVRGCDGGVVSLDLEDSIVVCCEVLDSRSPRVCSPRPVKKRITSEVGHSKVEDEGAVKGVVVPRFSLDLNAYAIDVKWEEGSYSHNSMEILNAVDGVFFFSIKY